MIFFFFFALFLKPLLRHVEVPRLGVQSELQPPAYARATATRDPSCICDLHHSSPQRRIPNLLSKARDRTHSLMVPTGFANLTVIFLTTKVKGCHELVVCPFCSTSRTKARVLGVHALKSTRLFRVPSQFSWQTLQPLRSSLWTWQQPHSVWSCAKERCCLPSIESSGSFSLPPSGAAESPFPGEMTSQTCGRQTLPSSLRLLSGSQKRSEREER